MLLTLGLWGHNINKLLALKCLSNKKTTVANFSIKVILANEYSHTTILTDRSHIKLLNRHKTTVQYVSRRGN